MLSRLSTNTLNRLLIIGIILLIIEVVFFHRGLVFSVLFSSLFLFVGWKRFDRVWGKVFFWIGAITLVIAIFNTIAVRFLLIAGIILFIIHFSRAQKDPEVITPKFTTHENVMEHEALLKVKPLLQQRLFGDEKTSDEAYEWNDVNIIGGFGDRIIDLSYTVLPNEAVISIRHVVGNIKIYVPYEVEVSIHHSSLFGRSNILGEHNLKLINQQFSFRTHDYKVKKPRVNIITSIWSGDLEVKRT